MIGRGNRQHLTEDQLSMLLSDAEVGFPGGVAVDECMEGLDQDATERYVLAFEPWRVRHGDAERVLQAFADIGLVRGGGV